MDFMKAFDKVPHVRLLQKIKAYGLSDSIFNWVQNFVSGRKQCVQVNGSQSRWHSVRDGPFNFQGGGVLKKYSDFGGGKKIII
jgi:hypothetical protein